MLSIHIGIQHVYLLHELLSAEGTTHGDPLSMAFYGINPVPLMLKLNEASEAVQCCSSATWTVSIRQPQ